MRVLSLFSGIGAFEKALERLGIEFELVNFCEFDKFAVKSYCEIHGVSEDKNLGDITKVDLDKLPMDIDLLTHGSPCQDFSVAGNGKGGDVTSNTRSSLMWNSVQFISRIRPRIVIWENVKNVLSNKHRHNFDKYLDTMEILGYTNYHKVLNAKDYGIPQNRERIFVVSILGEHKEFEFPQKKELKLRLKDMLEDTVDEKYYIAQEKVDKLISELLEREKVEPPLVVASRGRNKDNPSDRTPGNEVEQRLEPNTKGLCNTLTSVQKDNYVLECVGMLDIKGNEQVRRVYSEYGLSPCLNTMQGGNRQPKVLIDDTQGFEDVPRLYSEYSPTLRSCRSGLKVYEMCSYRIRKLIPLECFRLMGFDDADYYKVEKVNSNSQLYKQAGNSIVVNVLEEIYKQLQIIGVLK